ncbi:hypothetical protein SAMN05421854_11926 [Amycolatopsis rubida]|uniref:Uncharacterized protein n=1 Tax=Amycolatopsis rubida TaxID=112413 RepID=A0A1I6AI00_9PSEU|nr:hypothetical protein SAMN05421854_11926 [Amycolatopsis rubida]
MLRSPRPPALRGLARLERRFDGPRRGSRCPGGRSRRLAAGRAGTPPARPMTSVSSVRQVSEPRRFVLDLDGVPAVAPVRGSDFPFTVTASDPEQFRTTLELGEPVDVDWVMELDRICTACTGTVRIPETGHYTHFPLPEKYPPPCSACRPARTHRVDRELHDTQPPDHDVDVRRESRRVHRCRDLTVPEGATVPAEPCPGPAACMQVQSPGRRVAQHPGADSRLPAQLAGRLSSQSSRRTGMRSPVA